MIDHEAAGQPPDLRLVFGERAAVELDERVPAMLVRTTAHLVHGGPRQRAAE